MENRFSTYSLLFLSSLYYRLLILMIPFLRISMWTFPLRTYFRWWAGQVVLSSTKRASRAYSSTSRRRTSTRSSFTSPFQSSPLYTVFKTFTRISMPRSPTNRCTLSGMWWSTWPGPITLGGLWWIQFITAFKIRLPKESNVISFNLLQRYHNITEGGWKQQFISYC